jgi:DNA-binding response OmpR family regulator
VGFHVDGRRLRATPQVHELLGAVMRASGGLLKANILAERLGYEGDETTNLVAVLLTKARHAIAATGARFPIETVPRCGYRWNLDAQARTVTKHTVNAA